MGNYCLVASSTRISVEDCTEAEGSAENSDQFFQVGVPEFDAAGGAGMQSGAALLNAAARRQQVLLAKLQGALPKLGSCKFVVELARNSSHSVHLGAMLGRAASTS